MGTRWLAGSAVLVLTVVAEVPAQADPAPAGGGADSTVQGVVVTAHKPPVQTLLDRKVYSVATDLQSTVGTAADILNQVPSVDVDADGNVSLRGDVNVTVLVDGKPSAEFSGATRGLSLLQIPASDIDRIEVMTNPPARYKAEGTAGVINIITKKTRKAGFSGTGQLNIGDKRRFVAGLSGNYNVGKLNLSGSVSLRQDAKKRLTTTDLTTTGPTVVSHESINEHFLRLIPSVKAGADYQLNDRQTVGVSLNHRELSGKRFFDQLDQSSDASGAPIDMTNRHSNGHEWSVDSGESVHFDQKLWRPDETLSITFQHSRTAERERYHYTNTDLLSQAPLTFDDLHLSLDLITTELSVDYTLPMSGGRSLKLGYDFEDDNNRFDNTGDNIDPGTGLPVDNPNITNHFRYKQQINTAYGEYEIQTGPWDLQTGVRLEQTDARTLQITGNIPGGESYFRAYPSLHIDRALGDAAKLTLGVSRRITRPDPEALNPFTDFQDTHNLRAGNAKLLPQDTWSYELGYNASLKALTYGVTGYYRFNRDSVTDVTQVVSSDVVLTTKANLPKSRSAGFEFSANGKVTSQLSYNLSGNLFYDEIDANPPGVASAPGASALRSTEGINAKASLDYRPTAADTAQISFSRTDRRLTPQGSVSAIDLVNLGYRRQVTPALAALFTVSDAFDGQRLVRLINSPGLRETYQRYQIGQIAYVGFTYTFGAAKKAKASGFEYDQ